METETGTRRAEGRTAFVDTGDVWDMKRFSRKWKSEKRLKA
jgi:hypothetical protein